MFLESRLGSFVTFILLVGLLVAGSAPILASSTEVKAQPTQKSDDEREDSTDAAAPTKEGAATAGASTKSKGASDPAFNTLEDIVRMRGSAAVLLADCRPVKGRDHETVSLVWRKVED